MSLYQNPVIKGFNPDPSICRVGEDFYLITSTFEFFPGIPIYHSKNLVNWELINYCLTDDEQLNLHDAGTSCGLYAPTLRYHDGTFYMICTNVSHGGDFIVHTKDIRGKWSKPVWIENRNAIDPSLFFDDDGKCYYCCPEMRDDRQCIIAVEIDPVTGKTLGQETILTYGSGGRCAEGPHIYKINGFYYLMLAEGGTEYGHMETIFRSTHVFGPYVASPKNPLLTQRNLNSSPIQAVGHADLFEDQNHNWWTVSLGIRPLSCSKLHNLGRETFLAPVVWDEDMWPVAGNNGTLSLTMEGPLPGEAPCESPVYFMDHFDDKTLDLNWTFVRNPIRERYHLSDSKLYLDGKEDSLSDFTPTFVGVRQKEFSQIAETEIDLLHAENSGGAGITAFYHQKHYYSFSLVQEQNDTFLLLEVQFHDLHIVLSKTPYNSRHAKLRVQANMKNYEFQYWDNGEWKSAGKIPTPGLCTEITVPGSFTGTFLGIFAVNSKASFEYFCTKEV